MTPTTDEALAREVDLAERRMRGTARLILPLAGIPILLSIALSGQSWSGLLSVAAAGIGLAGALVLLYYNVRAHLALKRAVHGLTPSERAALVLPLLGDQSPARLRILSPFLTGLPPVGNEPTPATPPEGTGSEPGSAPS